jgi:CDGSH-type Zn-finger protein
MKQGDVVSVIDTDIVGEVVNVQENQVEIKLQNGSTILKNDQEVKRRKKCVCGMSKAFPVCDGSHSGN